MIVSTMPDVAKQAPNSQGTLTRVGMEGIAMPVLLGTQRVAAKLDATVSLDAKEARGIHMSRLYLGLAPLEQTPLSLGLVQSVLERFLASQEGLSQHAYLSIAGELPLERAALISPLSGWKYYPFTLRCELSPRWVSIGARSRGGLLFDMPMLGCFGAAVDSASLRRGL